MQLITQVQFLSSVHHPPTTITATETSINTKHVNPHACGRVCLSKG